MNEGQMETVISGSFRKYLAEIKKVVQSFGEAGITVLAPNVGEGAVNPDEEFIVLAEDDPTKPERKLEMEFLEKIRKASFLYVADVGGYVGRSAATEMAFARLNNVPVLTAEPIESFSSDIDSAALRYLRHTVKDVLPVSEIKRERELKE